MYEYDNGTVTPWLPLGNLDFYCFVLFFKRKSFKFFILVFIRNNDITISRKLIAMDVC